MAHCMWGMSRGASIVIACLVCDGYVKGKRGVVRPNQGFITQLEGYEQKLKQRELLEDKFALMT